MYDLLLLWFDTPVFGVLLSLIVYFLSIQIVEKVNHPLITPVIVSIALCLSFLKLLNIPVPMYQKGGDIITFFLGPMTIALSIPLYKQMHNLKKYFFPIIIGIGVGATTAILSTTFMAKIFGLDKSIIMSLAPKSTTAAIAIDISTAFGGNPALTIVLVTLAGLIGMTIGRSILKIFKISHPTAKGVALGTGSHALGTKLALEMGEEEGAMASLSIGTAGIITSLILPLILKILSL